MRYIADSSGYLKEVAFGCQLSCGGEDCTEYTGSVPSGYTSLEAWYLEESDKLYRWKIVSGNLTLDSSAVEPTDYPVADYVVEQGSVENWNYKKWNSGKAECFGYVTWDSPSWLAWGSLYYSSEYSPFANFPITFVNNPEVFVEYYPMATGNADGWVCVNANKSNKSQLGRFYIVRPAAGGAPVNLCISAYAVGRWK